MPISNIPIGPAGLSKISRNRYRGKTGLVGWRVQHLGNIHVCMLEYKPGYPGDAPAANTLTIGQPGQERNEMICTP